jgi:hypothetical protein
MKNIHDPQVVRDLADRITQARELLDVDGSPISEEVDSATGRPAARPRVSDDRGSVTRPWRAVARGTFASTASWPPISASRSES